MKKLIIPLIAIIFFMLSAGDVSACSCLADNEQSTGKKIQTAYKQSTAVFYGEVTEIKTKSAAGEPVDPNLEPVAVKFKVDTLWKGKITGEVVVNTAGNSAMCGFNFETGKRYLVYANASGNNFQTTICTRTAASNADAKYLDKIKKPKHFTRDAGGIKSKN